jgi:hypothetical protein
VLTNEKSIPIVRVDKSNSHINEAIMKWFCRLPREQADLLAIQRINEECSHDDGPISIEREVIKTLLGLMAITSYDKFDFYHYKAIQTENASVLVVGARGQGIFADVSYF